MSGIPKPKTPLATAPTIQTSRKRRLLTLIILYDDYVTQRKESESLIAQHTAAGWQGLFVNPHIEDDDYFQQMCKEWTCESERIEAEAARQEAIVARRGIKAETKKLMGVKRRTREIVRQLVR